MDLKQLTALVTVAEVGSITKAAQVLRLAQPSVTRQIKLLEEELGVALFERTRQGMKTTAEGDVLVERAGRALRELERARSEVRPDPGGVSGIVTLGLLESVVDVLAEPLVRAVAADHPGIELRLLIAYSGHLQQWLDAGDVDLSLLYNLASSPALSVVPLVDETLWALAPPGSSLSPDEPVPWADVLTQSLVLPVPGHGLRVLIDQALTNVEVAPRIAVQVNSMHLQKLLVRKGHGWSILPAAGVAADVAAGVLDGAPLCQPTVGRQVVLGLQRSGRIPAPAQAVTTVIGKVVRRLVRDGTWAGAVPVEPRTAPPIRPSSQLTRAARSAPKVPTGRLNARKRPPPDISGSGL